MALLDKFLVHGGYIADKKLTDEIIAAQPNPLMSGACYQIKESGRGKRVILSDFITKAIGSYNIRHQLGPDCTSMMGARCADILKAINVITKGEEWISETATEPIYSLSRIEVSKGRWGTGGGASGSATGQAVKLYGTLCRQKYGDIDLSVYDVNKALKWGSPGVGCPDLLEPLSKNHLIQSITLVNTYYEAIDALANGYPVGICSNVGFERTKNRNGQCVRDKNGLLYPGSSWSHAMTLISFDDSGPIKKVGVDNSWGTDWVTGPTDGLPDSAFWIEASILEQILDQQDSFCYSDMIGYPPKSLRWRL